ncbi:MAG: hypothetical protein JST53_00860 [Actinobacteria bacterium]|nr:hypothetical protein [Actinomycetota bacterium]
MFNVSTPTAPPPCPLTDPTTSIGEELVSYWEVWNSANEQIADLESRYQAAREEAKAAEDDLAELLVEAGPDPKATKALTAAETRHDRARVLLNPAPWQRRAQAAVEACYAAHAEYGTFLSANLDAVLAEPEYAAGGQGAAEAVTAAMRTTLDAIQSWIETRRKVAALAKHAEQIEERDIADLDASVGSARKAIESALTHPVSAPLPPRRLLDDRRVLRGEAELIEVDGPAGKGVQVVDR